LAESLAQERAHALEDELLRPSRRDCGLIPPYFAATLGSVVTVEEVRSFALTLPRTTEAIVRAELKVRAGRVAYVSFSSNDALMRFAFPKEWRDALIDAEPDKYVAPDECERRYSRALVVSQRSTRPRCASSSSTRGRLSCPSE
jgi:hypothetical protein